jgi:hypothetical protein
MRRTELVASQNATVYSSAALHASLQGCPDAQVEDDTRKFA